LFIRFDLSCFQASEEALQAILGAFFGPQGQERNESTLADAEKQARKPILRPVFIRGISVYDWI
jgi:hypothetical protein